MLKGMTISKKIIKEERNFRKSASPHFQATSRESWRSMQIQCKITIVVPY